MNVTVWDKLSMTFLRLYSKSTRRPAYEKENTCKNRRFKFPYVHPSVKVPIATNLKGVCLQNASKPHLYHLKIWRLL